MKTSVDAILRGQLLLEQPARGYRFNVDALLLAAFAREVLDDPARVVDLGAGCGVVGLALAKTFPRAQVALVEVQPELAELCERNIRRNGLEERVEVSCSDLRDGSFAMGRGPTLLCCNPPFFPVGRGKLNSDPLRARARHELTGSLAELLASAAAAVRTEDALALVHDAQRANEVQGELESAGLRLSLRRDVLPFPGRPPRRVLFGARRSGQGLRELAPLVLHDLPGVASAELAAMLGDEGVTVSETR
ncbi:MAG: hypothetical protein CSA24_00340 [Deltaproteobacteria bacterium]|nr:MAG: hypothetical protein CSB49_03060 [Pseudomonadota bacterium]PIE66344.1 MAG: hypothetical protein CSA24_00340 [Deltaproteobacteria bacterium]